MTGIILSGCNGKMGQVITRLISTRDDCAIVAGIDPGPGPQDYQVFPSASACTVQANAIIDFSHPAALEALLDMAVSRKIPLVAATTGLSESQEAALHKAAETIPVFRSANMSLGINVMLELAKIGAKTLGKDFDIEILEKHHNQKIDAPSGTAYLLADGISQVLTGPPEYKYERHSKREKRGKAEIGLHAVRGGTIVGEHDVIFAGHDEILTIRHTAYSKEVFAAGAINAALFLSKQPPGFYGMADLIRA